ncbi:MAG: threonylcarbamoyl-AMP synthase [Saprospiraceae bacterium]|nr:threonylcarbamoyl-AMP synthase [Pyrinomonadaceae bacterium]
MQTVLTESPADAADFIKLGGIVAFPTETVYGLGADIFNEAAIAKVFEAKQRPADNPFIAHIGGLEQIGQVAAEIPDNAQKFIEDFFPGPLTLVLRKANDVPLIATAGLDTIGVRMPRNPIASEFLNACATPLVAPSANISGKPSPTSWQAVFEDLNYRIDCILQGESTEIGLESTVVDCTGSVPILLRFGSISLAMLRSIVPETRTYHAEVNEAPRSPGLKHRHYAPNAKVVLIDFKSEISNFELQISDSGRNAFIGIHEPDTDLKLRKICGSVKEYAATFFEFFRECDRRNIKTIYCETVDETGIGAALMDRLRRAEAR